MNSTLTLNEKMKKAFQDADLYEHGNHAINCVTWAVFLLKERDNANFDLWAEYYFSKWGGHYSEYCKIESERMGDAVLEYYSKTTSVTNVQQTDWLYIHLAQTHYYNTVYVLFSAMKRLSLVVEVFSTSGNEDLNVFCELAEKYCGIN